MKVEEIKELSVAEGLERVRGQLDVYKKSLRLTIKEIEKCCKNLNKFLSAGDMRNFSIEAHGMKGLLSNIGALEIAPLALELEEASHRGDSASCASALPSFLNTLNGLGSSLVEFFAFEDQNLGPVEISPELPAILEKLEAAFVKDDLLAIAAEVESLDALNSEGALKEEIEKIKDAIMMADYDDALEVIRELLKH